ncbi:YcaO-like family protein [Halorhabdus amylolytica]|uniref:YcaO-like family protein n=1 Tax=Halorhabdus amylolytica TaxID=2559573 RepID=UPI0010AA2374|nr:YcaO-like family protein [Halorhabdus amylolytica]
MTVGIAGSGPAVEAIEAALSDVDVRAERREALDVGAFELGIVVDVAGSTAFERVNDVARETNAPWIAVELGGVGGVPVVDAAITGFDGTGGCYACLETRVRSNVDPTEQPTEAPRPTTARYAGAIAGRAAAGFLDDGTDGPDVFGHVIEIPHERRRLLAVPHCGCGTEPTRKVERTTASRGVEESLALAERGIDDRVGIVREVGEIHSYPLPYYLARSADTGDFSDATAPSQAAGVALDWDEAFMRALGEAYERYAAGVYRTETFRKASYERFDTAVPPASFVTPSPPDRDRTRLWIDGENLTTGQSVQLPASLVLYPPPGEDVRPATTTGLGFGNANVEALLSGLYEVLERDAAMLAWYSTFEPLGLAVEDERFETLVSRLEAEGLSVSTLLLTQDVDVPVVACAVHRDDGEWPRFAIGSSADLDPAAAARSALTEATQNWLELGRMGPDRANEAGGAIGEYADFPDEVRSFVDPGSVVPAGDVGADPVPTGEAELTTLIERVIDADMTPYGARLTTRDLAMLGFEAVRVLVPEAQPLFLGEPYFGDRLDTVPDELGFESRPDRAFHPFP